MGRKTSNNHRYYINKHGEKVRRVSDVIRILAKDQITVWANMLGFKGVSYKKELERTANIGSLFHSIAEMYFNTDYLAVVDYEEFGVWDYDSQLEARHAVESFFLWFKEFKKTHTYNVKFTELIVVGEELGGTIDCGIEGWKDPNKVIFVDYKTSGSFYLTQFLQLAAYTSLYEENYGPNTVEGIMVILANKKESKPAKARFISRKNLEPFITCFQCMYDVAVGTNILEKNLRELSEVIE